jgi:hypothetical protein
MISKLPSENMKTKRLLATHRLKWEDYSELDRKETGWKHTDWVHLAQYNDKILKFSVLQNEVNNFA